MFYICTRNNANGVLVQLVRMPACHAGGHGFESRTYRKTLQRVFFEAFFLFIKVLILLQSANHGSFPNNTIVLCNQAV